MTPSNQMIRNMRSGKKRYFVLFCGLPGPQKELISARIWVKMESLTRGNERMRRNKGCVGKLQEIKNGY